MDKVSIVITFLKQHVKYLHGLMESIQRKSYTNLELVIIDQTQTVMITDYLQGKTFIMPFHNEKYRCGFL